MSEILMAVMPYSHYEGACNAIREATGKTDKIPSGQFEAEVRNAIASGGGGNSGGNDEPVNYSKGFTFKTLKDNYGGIFAYYISGIGTCKDTEMFFPPTYRGYPVLGVGEEAGLNIGTVTKLVIPDCMTCLADNSFYCENLSSLTLGNGLKHIGGIVFAFSLISSVEIPDSVTSIGYMAFYSCVNLTNATIGKGVTRLDEGVFSCCDNLKTVKFLGETPPTFGEGMFDECPMLERIEVPANSLDAYKSTTNASQYADLMVGV